MDTITCYVGRRTQLRVKPYQTTPLPMGTWRRQALCSSPGELAQEPVSIAESRAAIWFPYSPMNGTSCLHPPGTPRANSR